MTETHRARRGRGGLRQDAPRRRAALGGGPLMTGTHRAPRHLRARSRSTAAPGTSTTTSGSSATTREVRRHRRRARRRRHRRPRSATGRSRPSCCTHAHNDHIDAAPELADAYRRADPAAPGRPDAVGACVYPDASRTHALADGRRSRVAGIDAAGAAHPRPRARRGLPATRPSWARVFTGDTLFQGGPGRDRPVLLDFPTIIDSIRDRLLTLPPDDRRAHRPRRLHDDRRRGPAPGGVDRPRPLTCVLPNIGKPYRSGLP